MYCNAPPNFELSSGNRLILFDCSSAVSRLGNRAKNSGTTSSLLYEKSVEAMANLRTSDKMAEKIAISYDAFSNNVRAYHEISERAYLNARDKVLPSVMPENFQAEPGR